MRFADVIGNERVAGTLAAMADSGRVAHAMLLYENEGCGALALALLTASRSQTAHLFFAKDSTVSPDNSTRRLFVALGVANIVSALFGGVPAALSFDRTAANRKLGAKSPLSGMICSISLLLILLFFLPLVGRIPLSAVAAILIAVGLSAIPFKTILHRCKKAPKTDLAVSAVTLVLTVLLDPLLGIFLGWALYLLLLKRRKNAPAPLDQEEETL